MSKAIVVVVIDPFTETVKQQMITDNENPDLFTKLMDCRVFDVVRLGSNVIMYVDDEGLLLNNNRYFKLGDEPDAHGYAGISIIACADKVGGTISYKNDISTIEELVTFMPDGYSEEPYMEFFPIH